MFVHRTNFAFPDIHKTNKITAIMKNRIVDRDVFQDKIHKCCLQFLFIKQEGFDSLVTFLVFTNNSYIYTHICIYIQIYIYI